jgi:tetratricopeptide (TPR) repeat protein
MKGFFIAVCSIILLCNSTDIALYGNSRKNVHALDTPKRLPQVQPLQPWQRIDSLQALLQHSFGTERLALLHTLADEYAIQRPQYGLRYTQEAIRLAKKLGNYPALAQSYYDEGLVQWEQGNNDAAQAAYFSGLKISEEIRDSLLLAKAWFGLASIAHNRNRPEEALRYSRQALEIVTRHEDYALQARILNLMGVAHRALKRLDSALLLFHQSLAVHERHLITQRVYMPLFNIGYTLYFRHQYADASEYIFKALRAALQQGNVRVTAESYLTVADIARAERNVAIALEFCEQGRQLADSLGLKPTLAEAYFTFAEIYRAQGKFREALHYRELYHTVNDSLISVQSSATITELQSRYNAEKREQQIAAELNAKELVQQRLLLLLVMVAVIAGLLGYLFYTKQRTAKELTASNEAILAQQRIMEEQAQEIELINRLLSKVMRTLKIT